MVEPYIKVFDNRSVLVKTSGETITYIEGPPDEAAKERLRRIKTELDGGWLEAIITESISSRTEELPTTLEEDTISVINKLVDSVTSEIGRALVGLLVLQLTVKAIEPNQSVRLHKGGRGNFSWKDGIPMRTLDNTYVTPVLREFDLLRLNADGFMMTRSLAENYPYTIFYKAAVRGAKNEWLWLVDKMEDNLLDAEEALKILIGLLANRSEKFKELADETVELAQEYINKSPSLSDIYTLITTHITQSTYSARLLEVAMHSLIQVIEEEGLLEGEGKLLPLCQMRTANKKHDNIGDIEIADIYGNEKIVLEAWDAKYGKPYLRDELEEVKEKLEDKPDVRIVGFVVDTEPDIKKEIKVRLEEIKELTGTEVKIISFRDWITYWLKRTKINEDDLGKSWIIAYAESLGQKRREKAPIDEPSDEWVKSLQEILQENI